MITRPVDTDGVILYNGVDTDGVILYNGVVMDFWSLLSLGGQGLRDAAGFGGWVSGMVMSRKDRKQRQEMFDKNFELQKQQFEYEKALQEKIFEREDNSVQRRVADLKASGINPLLAAGQGAHAGSVVPVHAPQKEYADRGAMIDLAVGVMNLMKARQDISISREEQKRLRLDNEYSRRTMDARVAAVERDSEFKDVTFDDRVASIALSNDKTAIDIEVASQRRELYVAETDKVKVDTAVQNVELTLKKALDKAGLRLFKFQEELLALQVANNIKYKDAKAFHDLGVATHGRPTEKVIQFLHSGSMIVLDQTIGSAVRAIQKKMGKEPDFDMKLGVHNEDISKHRRKYVFE